MEKQQKDKFDFKKASIFSKLMINSVRSKDPKLAVQKNIKGVEIQESIKEVVSSDSLISNIDKNQQFVSQMIKKRTSPNKSPRIKCQKPLFKGLNLF